MPERNGFEAWRQLVAEKLQPGMGEDLAKFEGECKSWEQHVGICGQIGKTKAQR